MEKFSLFSFFQKFIYSILGILTGLVLFIGSLQIWLIVGASIELIIGFLGGIFLYKKYSHYEIIKYASLSMIIFNLITFILLLVGTATVFSLLNELGN